MGTNTLDSGAPDRRETDTSGEHYFEVSTKETNWWVSATMARFIESRLDARRPPVWVTFVEITGARVRVRCSEILSLSESSPDQRAASRAVWRNLKRERKADRDYDVDDDD